MHATSSTGTLAGQISPESVLERLERWVDAFAPGLAVALVAAFAAWAWLASRGLRFWFDELLELSAATAPTNREVVQFLASGIDFNPPLSHFLIRASVSLFGNAEWAARLPSFLGIVTALVCLYLFVSRRLTGSYGVMAMLVFMCLPARVYAHEARPYGLLLGFSALSLVFYQLYRATGSARTRLAALAGFSISIACLPATHYYGILPIGAFFLAETIAAWKSRRPDWTLLACSSIPPLLVLFSLRNVMRQQRQQLTHYFAQGSLLSFDDGFDFLAMEPFIYGMGMLLVASALVYYFYLRDVKVNFRPVSNFPSHEAAAAVWLLLLPIVGAVFSRFVTHAYLARYFIPAALGFTICLCYAVRFFSSLLPGLVILTIVPLGVGFGKTLMHEITHGAAALPPSASLSAENTPILFDTPGEYIVIYHYFPGLRDKIWVVADPPAALRYRKYDTDDRIMLALASKGSAQAISLSAAARRWSHFGLIPRAGDHIGALQCVMEAGAQIQVKYPFGDTNFIYDVTVSPENLPIIDSCSAGQ